VELIGILALLVLLQCGTYLPAGVAGFASLAGRTLVGEGPRWWFQNPLPGPLTLMGTRPLVELEADGLRPRSDPRHPLSGQAAPSSNTVAADTVDRVEARGAVVWIAGRRFVRAPDEGCAHWLAGLLRADAGTPIGERLQAAARSSTVLADLRDERARFEDATQALAIGSALDAALLLIALPAAAAWVGIEAALYWSWPIVVIGHVTLFGVLVRSVRALAIDYARLELLLPALLYPPALLRARNDLARRQLSRFHPAAHAAQLLETGALREFLRREFARLDHPRGSATVGPVAAAERAGLCDLLYELEIPESELLAGPTRRSPDAAHYCPVCLDEFMPDGERCRTCDVPLLDYASP